MHPDVGHRVRRLTALRTDLAWVSAARNKTTRCYSLADDDGTYRAGAFWAARAGKSPMDTAPDYGHFACENPENSLI
jgi:hypothetical protein